MTPRHEQGAGYAADGYARVTGRPGVAITTTGPALLNIAAAVGQAYSDSVPLLVVSPGMPLRHPRGDRLLHEMRSQTEACAQVAAFSHRVSSVEEIGAAVARAFTLFRTGRPRPVHIEIPLDLLESAESAAPPRLSPPVQPAAPRAEQLARAGEALRTREPAGAGAGRRRPRGRERTAAPWSRSLAAPVVTTANGKGVVAESHPLSLGVSLHSPAVQKWLADCDVVLAVGTELAESDLWSEPAPLGGTLVRVDLDPAQMYAGLPADIPLVGDAQETCGAARCVPRGPEREPGSPVPAPGHGRRYRGGRTPGRRTAAGPGRRERPDTDGAEGAEAVEDRRGAGLRAADGRPVVAGPGARTADGSAPEAGAEVVAEHGLGTAGADHEPGDVTAGQRMGVAEHRTGVAAVAELRAARDGETRERDARWLPFLAAMRSVLRADAVFTSDSAQCCYYGALPHLPRRPAGRYLHPTGFGTLGYALPAAIGAKAAPRTVRSWRSAATADCSSAIQELATAAQLRLPLPVVVFDNGGYGEIRDEMAARGDAPVAVDLRPSI